MTGHLPIHTRPMTPDEVLDGLRDILCRTTGQPWAVVVSELQLDTALLDLAVEEVGFDPVWVELYFGTGPLSDEWWQRVWEFGTIRGLCMALAQFVEVPVIEPVTVLGRPSPSAGAFLTVRALLARAGADVSDLRPSTPLLPYLWLWPGVFRWELPRMAPGRIPEVRFQNRRLTRRVLGAVIGLGGLVFSFWVAKHFPAIGAVLAGVFVKVFLLDLLRTPFAARARNWSVEFGDLYDFRDLVAALLGDRQAATAAA
jgi:hypothetical protein